MKLNSPLSKLILVTLTWLSLALASCAVEDDDLGLKGEPRIQNATDLRPKPDNSYRAQREYHPDYQQQSIFFAQQKQAIQSERYDAMLNRVVTFLNDNPNALVQLQGNAAEKGSAGYNLTLSYQRAARVKVYLIELGASPAQLTTVAYGKAKPVYSEAAKNRRVDIVYLGLVHPTNYQLSLNRIPLLKDESVVLSTYPVNSEYHHE